jgi:iron complex transport system permease protein
VRELKKSLIALNILLVFVAVFIALSVGPTKIDGFFQQLMQPGSNEILWQIRFPRVIAAVIVGAAFGVAGLMAQGASNNALAEPSILGTSSGAALGAVIAILFGLAQVGSIAATISGVISFWNFGSLALITYENLVGVAATTLIGLGIAWKVAPSLDRLSLGDDTAFHLGINVVKARWLALVALSLLAGGAVSTVGIIGFIGLAAPHLARFIYGPSHRLLVIQSALIGSLIIVIADTLARSIAAPNELSIGLITSLLGAPILIALVSLKSNVWRVQ